jgi:hypothetical protein
MSIREGPFVIGQRWQSIQKQNPITLGYTLSIHEDMRDLIEFVVQYNKSGVHESERKKPIGNPFSMNIATELYGSLLLSEHGIFVEPPL